MGKNIICIILGLGWVKTISGPSVAANPMSFDPMVFDPMAFDPISVNYL